MAATMVTSIHKMVIEMVVIIMATAIKIMATIMIGIEMIIVKEEDGAEMKGGEAGIAFNQDLMIITTGHGTGVSFK